MILVETWQKFKKIAWFLPGFLLYAAFPPMGEMTDILFALAPLMWLSRQGDAKTSAKRWAQSGIFFWVATLSWMPAIVKNGGPWPLVLLGWFALAAYCTAYFAAYGWLSAAYWGWVRGGAMGSSRPTGVATGPQCPVVWRIIGILLVEPVLWCGLELIRSRFGGGFAWNQLGVVPANAGFGGPAAIGGVYLLSAVVVMINGSIAGIAERVLAKTRNRWGTLETLAVFVVIWGIYSVPPPALGRGDVTAELGDAAAEAAGGTESLKVALVQRNFPCCFKAQEESPIAVYSNLLATASYLKPDLVVLPESAMSEFGPLDQQGGFRFARWVQRLTDGAALLSGGTRYGDGVCYNSAGLYQVGGEKVEVEGGGGQRWPLLFDCYDKVHLVPFGEFIPGDKWFPVLQKLAPVGSCWPGEVKVLKLERRDKSVASPLAVGVAICYEDTDSALCRELAAKGARFLCFITNDSWFSESNEAWAHAWQATARAIETGLPVVRVGNSGVTGVITPDGRRSWLVGADGKVLVDKAGVMMERVELLPAAGETHRGTVYTWLGDGPLGILFALLIGAMILVEYANKFERERILK